MRTNLRSRVEKLEAALAPTGSVFLMGDHSWNQDRPLEERLAAFKIENGVGPYDTVCTTRFLRADEPEPGV